MEKARAEVETIRVEAGPGGRAGARLRGHPMYGAPYDTTAYTTIQRTMQGSARST